MEAVRILKDFLLFERDGLFWDSAWACNGLFLFTLGFCKNNLSFFAHRLTQNLIVRFFSRSLYL